MKYDDLEKTKELFLINEDVPTPIENIEMEGINKDTLVDDFTLNLTDKEEKLIKKSKENKTEKEKKPKEKKGLKEKWQNLTKKQKALIISIISLIFLIIIAIILVLVLKDDKEKPVDKPQEEEKPKVVLEKENYIYIDGKLSLLDKDDNELGIYECQNKDEKLCFVANFSNEDDFDIPKSLYEDGSIVTHRSSIFQNKYVFIHDSNSEINESLILYNIAEQKEEGTYNLVKGFSGSNYVIVKKDNKYGALEFSTEGIVEKIKFTYDYLGIIDSNSKVVAKTNNKYFIYNREGKLDSKGFSNPIKSFNNNYVVIENNGEVLYDYKANKLLNDTYDYIRLLDDYVVVIKDNKLSIRDYKNNKFNEEEIELYNNHYNEEKIYNKENVLEKESVSFKINIIDNNIEVIYYNKNDKEKSVVLNSIEGKVSKKYPNLNYIDGKLYFYKEEKKENLLGVYTCTNKNNLENEASELTSCIVAAKSDNTGWLPIINERYIFINDSLDQNNKTIVLYDLKNNKALSRYANVNIDLDINENKITFVSNNDLYIIAENRKNEYGVIKFEDEVKSIIPFEYKSIEKLKNYFRVEKTNGTYLLLDNIGSKVTTKEIGNKIVDYRGKYLKTENNSVYDFEGNEKGSNFRYVELYDTYFVVINSDNKLDIREYESEFKLPNPIEVGDTTDYSNAFEVSKTGDKYTIKIKTTGETTTISSAIENIPNVTPEIPSEE